MTSLLAAWDVVGSSPDTGDGGEREAQLTTVLSTLLVDRLFFFYLCFLLPFSFYIPLVIVFYSFIYTIE